MSSLSRQVTPETPGTSSISTPTTSPNEFFSLDPCSHLAQVLNSNAKDTALRNYGLAVKVIKFSKTSPRNLSNLQQKDPKSKPVDRSRLMRLRSKVLKCKDCYVNVGNTYICLQCPQVGCFKNRHFVNHAKMAGHIFG
jgi:ubiquitin carboxyl-terminal hydrolase 22/27/51